MQDIQTSRVYHWEDSLPLSHTGIFSQRRCSMKRCKELIAEACQLYKVKQVQVRLPRNPKQSYAGYYDRDKVIILPLKYHQQDVALHEVAHHITVNYWPRSSEHGEIFVRVYMHLMSKLLEIDISYLEMWAKLYKVKFSKSERYSPAYACLN